MRGKAGAGLKVGFNTPPGRGKRRTPSSGRRGTGDWGGLAATMRNGSTIVTECQ